MKRLFAWIGRNERHLSTAVFVGGFVLDLIGYTHVNLPFVDALFAGFLVAAAVCIIVSHALHKERPDAAPSWKRPFHTLLPMASQFFLGGLLSGCLIFYTRSASIAHSWPFILLLAAVFIGNELFHKYRDRLTFQTVLFFFTLYAYAIFAVPIARGLMNQFVFLESGAISVLIFAAFLGILWAISAPRLAESLRPIAISSLVVLFIVNAFYFTGVLPPLPLSLKDAGVYYGITWTSDGYRVQEENAPWRLLGPQVIHHAPGTALFAYSAVFAPVALTTPIVHRWQKYEGGEWVTVAAIAFPVSGGRDGGYRGYSEITAITPGKWRVSIETKNGSVLGRERFDVEAVVLPPAVYTEIK